MFLRRQRFSARSVPMAVLPQARAEALLSDALTARGVVPERGIALGSFEQDEDGVEATLI